MTPLSSADYQAVLHAPGLDELKQAVQAAVQALGFDGFLYLMLLDTHPPAHPPATFVLSTYDPRLVQTYQGNHCYRFDPTAIHIRQHQYPIIWGEETFAGPKAQAMYATACRYGVRSGAVFPVAPPSVSVAGFAYACDRPLQDMLPCIEQAMPYGLMLANFTHHAVNRLLNLYPAPLLQSITERERACLDLAAQGIRDNEIAERLGITRRTVLFHLGNARRKLGADNRSQMIARAMALKVIGI